MIKLLRSCLKLIDHARVNLKAFSESGELKEVVQSQIVKFVSSQMNYTDECKDSKYFTNQQLMFLELHLAIEKIREEANLKHGCHIPKFLSDSLAICHVKKFMQIMKEKDSFDLLKYLYHLKALETE